MGRIKVLVVDDSALVRKILSDMLSTDPDIEVVGTAVDPYAARDKIKELSPDVLTLDIEMPRMDGLTFLKILMRDRPMPVVMISTLTEDGADATLRALELGAVDFIAKPKVDVNRELRELAADVVARVKGAATARLRRVSPQAASGTQVRKLIHTPSSEMVIAIGASTGGTEAIAEVLRGMPANSPGILIVQHMPERFTRAFAQRCDSLCAMRVKEAEDGDHVVGGQVLIAPGNQHMRFFRDGAHFAVRLDQQPPVTGHRPSVDALFHSVAMHAKGRAVGVILTGMGNDGAEGLRAMHDAGARTVAQDEQSCVVFGMPKQAIALHAVDEILSIEQIAEAALRLAGA